MPHYAPPPGPPHSFPPRPLMGAPPPHHDFRPPPPPPPPPMSKCVCQVCRETSVTKCLQDSHSKIVGRNDSVMNKDLAMSLVLSVF